MQFAIAIAIVAGCLFMVLRGLARSIFPQRFKRSTGGACACSGGCPALKRPLEPRREHRPAA